MPAPAYHVAKLLLPVAVAMAWAATANAAAITDPAGDFLPTYIGPQNGDVDALSAEVTFDGTTFTLRATLAGEIGTTPGAFYVLGINRGGGTARFGAAAPNILFDAVGVFRPVGQSLIADLSMGAPVITPLPASVLTVSGSSLTGVLPLSLLPSTGFAASDYTFNLWPRIGDGNLNQISDFAPDNANFSAVPEPAAVTLLLGGVGLLGWKRRRSKSA